MEISLDSHAFCISGVVVKKNELTVRDYCDGDDVLVKDGWINPLFQSSNKQKCER